MLSIVTGMDAVSYKQLKNLTASKTGYPIMLRNGMDAVNAHNPNGC